VCFGRENYERSFAALDSVSVSVSCFSPAEAVVVPRGDVAR
jgi:hypothetical protein